MTKKKWQAVNDRKAARYSDVGRHFEIEVESYLSELKEQGRISSFTRHNPFSLADMQGKDFSVVFPGRESEPKPFGVTISLRRWNLSKRLHPEIPQFCFPIGTNKGTIIRRIMELAAIS